MWYCAHAIFYFESDRQESYLIYENVYLIRSKDEESALLEAIKIAKDNEDLNEDGHLLLNEKPARYLFAGIRKIVEVETNYQTAKGSIVSGTEVTYSEMEVDSLDEVNRLANGDFVGVLYRE